MSSTQIPDRVWPEPSEPALPPRKCRRRKKFFTELNGDPSNRRSDLTKDVDVDERTDLGTLPVNRLSAIERCSKPGSRFEKFKSPVNLLEATSRTRRRVREDNSGGMSPTKLLFARSRISSFLQSAIVEGIGPPSKLWERE